MAQIDTFICGCCQETFHDINLFIVHKNKQCVVMLDEHADQQLVYTAVQEEPASHEAQHDGQVVEDDGQINQQQETITVIQQVDADGMVIAEGQENDGERQMCLIELNETEDSAGITSGIHLVPLQRMLNAETFTQNHMTTLTTDVGEVHVMLADNGQQQPEDEIGKPPRRRPGRPKKGEEKTPKVTAVKKYPDRATPEVDDDGRVRCPRCKKTFGKHRHFLTHRCLAITDYVDTMKREVLSPDEASDNEDEAEEEKQDKSVNFKFASAAPRRGRPPKYRTVSRAPTAGSDLPPGNEQLEQPDTAVPPPEMFEMPPDGATVGDGADEIAHARRGRPRAHDSKKLDIELPISKDQIANIPVFADEEEKLEFEESLNVEFTEVDNMYKMHIIDQNVNEHAPPPASRTSNELSVFSCNICDKVFKTVSHMRLHCLTHTNNKPFRCTKCSYGSNSKGNLYTHMRIHTGQFYTCPACNFQTPNKTHLIEHMATHSKMRHKCALCKKDYNTLKSMMNHVRKYHLTKAGKEYLEKFQGKHNQGTAVLHQCHICLRKFKKKIDRDRHLFVHNIRGLPNIHECDLCDYTASRRRYMEAHFQKHRVVYVCSECNSKFPSSVRLNQHLNQDHGVSEASKNWMEVFQACISSSLYLPEPDGSTDGLFGGTDGETENATHILEEKGAGEVTEGVEVGEDGNMGVEPVHVLKVDSDVTVVRDDQSDRQFVEADRVVDHTDMVLLPSPGQADSNQLEVEAHGGEGEMQAAELRDEPVDGGQIPDAPGELVDSELADDMDECDAEGVENLEDAEDYDIYKRLNYAQMSWDVFHKLRVTFGTEECEYCGRLFYSKSDFNPHFRSHTGERPFPCKQCTYRASTKDALKRHVEKEHDKVTYVCQQCDFVASSRTQLWHHQQRHKEPQEVKCTACQITLPSVKRLKAHLSVKHPTLDKALVKKMLSVCQKPQGKLGRRSHKCPYCSKTFMRGSADLQKHIWIHQGIKPFKCTLCSHACRSKNNLMSHMMRHSSEKPFVCNECGKAYKSRTALRWHVRTHKEGKIFRCVKCSYEAVQYSHLKRHMQTHDVVKRFVCQHCNYSANTIGYMKIHYTRHHKGQEYHDNPNPAPQMAPGTKVYRCLSCDYLFGNLSDIKRHLKVRHHVSVEDIHALDNIEAEQPQMVDLTPAPNVVHEGIIQPESAVIHDSGDVVMHQETVVDGEHVNTVDVAVPREDAEQHVPQSEVQVVEMMEPGAEVVATSEEQDASSALQALQFSVPHGSMDPQTASAVSIIQQIIGISKQGAFAGQQHITVQAEDGQSYIAVSPDTIIVQQDSDELVITGDGHEGEQQYVIQYVTQGTQDGSDVMPGTDVRADTEVVTEEHCHAVDQQVVEMELSDAYTRTEDEAVQEGMDVILGGQEAMDGQAIVIKPAMGGEGMDVGTMEVQTMPVQIYTDVQQETTIEEQTITTEVVAES